VTQRSQSGTHMKSEILLTHEAQLLKHLTTAYTMRKYIIHSKYTLKIINYYEHVTYTNFQYLFGLNANLNHNYSYNFLEIKVNKHDPIYIICSS